VKKMRLGQRVMNGGGESGEREIEEEVLEKSGGKTYFTKICKES
jgi:hypothetical protein